METTFTGNSLTYDRQGDFDLSDGKNAKQSKYITCGYCDGECFVGKKICTECGGKGSISVSRSRIVFNPNGADEKRDDR